MIGNGTDGRRQHRTDARRPRAGPNRSNERGQTTQDFAVGIGLFLLAIAFVFLFLPSVMTPFDSSVSQAETAQADRIADRIVNDTSTGAGNEIDFTEYENEDNLTEDVGLRASSDDDVMFDRVNVTIEPFNDSGAIDDDWTAGEVYREEPAASAARIVTIKDEPTACQPACRLVVRVW